MSDRELLENIFEETKKFNRNLVNLEVAIRDVVDRMDSRSEKALLENYDLLIRLRSLEEYIGVEYKNPRKEKTEKHIKARKQPVKDTR